MREMKESGIRWVGKIPYSWKVDKNKHCFNLEKNIVGDKVNNYELLSLTKRGVIKKDENSIGGKVPESFETYQSVKEGQIVMCLFDLDVSAVFSGLSPYNGMISPAYKIYNCNKNIYNKYAKYWFECCFDGRKYKAYSKSLRYVVNTEDFGPIEIVIPPIEEQHKIADFLDKKISEIDSVIEKTKSTIEDYKKFKEAFILDSVCRGFNKDSILIDSDDKWLWKVPSYYKIIKLNKIANIVRGGSPRPAGDLKYYDGDIPFMKISDITKDDKMYVNECKDSIKEAGLSRTRYIEKNTLLLTNSGATLGIPKINTFKTTFNDGIAAFMNLKSNIIDIEFAYYSLKARTKYFLEEASMGMGQPNLNTDIIGETKIVLPEIKEQKEIVKIIRKKCEYIDKLIECKEKIVKELEQYKKSLIYEYVTGKKEVI